MGYCLNQLDEPVFMAGAKPMRAEFGIHRRLESCAARSLGVMYMGVIAMKINRFFRSPHDSIVHFRKESYL